MNSKVRNEHLLDEYAIKFLKGLQRDPRFNVDKIIVFKDGRFVGNLDGKDFRERKENQRKCQ